jgi:putative flippase GtrA
MRLPGPLRQVVRFGTVGVLQNAVNVACFALAREAGVHYRVAAILAGFVGFVLSFWLNRHWTFSGRQGAIERHVAKYTVAYAGAVVLGVVLLTLFVEVGGVPAVAAQVLAIVVVAPASFLVQRAWVFAGEAVAPVGRESEVGAGG